MAKKRGWSAFPQKAILCETLCLQVDFASSMAIIIASQNSTITVHANKAIVNSGAGYLALSLRTRKNAPLYEHYVPGCNGTSFLSVVSVYNDTCLAIDKFGIIGELPRRQYYRTMQVCAIQHTIQHIPTRQVFLFFFRLLLSPVFLYVILYPSCSVWHYCW